MICVTKSDKQYDMAPFQWKRPQDLVELLTGVLPTSEDGHADHSVKLQESQQILETNNMNKR